MQIFHLKNHESHGMEYSLIDCKTGLVYGPYDTLNEARAYADALPAWEIIDGSGDLIDWSRGFEETANARTGTHGQARPTNCEGETEGLAILQSMNGCEVA